jgi:ankyrin repeat protein
MSFEKMSGTSSIDWSSLMPPQLNPLLRAIVESSPAKVQELLKQGHNPNFIAPNGNSLLHMAIQHEDRLVEIIDLLLQYGATNDVLNSNAETPLYVAVRNSSPKTVELLLRAKANPNLQCAKQLQTPLHLVIRNIVSHDNKDPKSSNWLRNFYLLLHYGADLRVATGYGNTGWNLIGTDKAWLVNYLKEWEETITATMSASLSMSSSSSSVSPEQEIVDNIVRMMKPPLVPGNEESLKNLMRSVSGKAHLLALSDSSGCHTIMHRLVENDKRHFVELAYNKVGNVDIKNKENETLLLRAIRHEHENMALLLLDLGAKPNVTTLSGESPLLVAVQNKLKKVVEALIAKNADVNAPIHQNGLTPLFAAIEADDPDMVRWLLNAGADTEVTLHGKTPLQKATLKNNPDILELLSSEVVVTPAKSRKREQGQISRSTACLIFFSSAVRKEDIFTEVKRGNVDKVTSYMRTVRDINAKNAEGLTALHIAVTMGHEGVVRALLTHKQILVDELKRNGETALHLAIRHQRHGITQLLLNAGANPNQKRYFDAITPFYLAIRVALRAGYPTELTAQEHFLTISQLLQYKADPTIVTNSIGTNHSHTVKQLIEFYGMNVETFGMSAEMFATDQRSAVKQPLESVEMIAETFLDDSSNIVEPNGKRQRTISRGIT